KALVTRCPAIAATWKPHARHRPFAGLNPWDPPRSVLADTNPRSSISGRGFETLPPAPPWPAWKYRPLKFAGGIATWNMMALPSAVGGTTVPLLWQCGVLPGAGVVVEVAAVSVTVPVPWPPACASFAKVMGPSASRSGCSAAVVHATAGDAGCAGPMPPAPGA